MKSKTSTRTGDDKSLLSSEFNNHNATEDQELDYELEAADIESFDDEITDGGIGNASVLLALHYKSNIFEETPEDRFELLASNLQSVYESNQIGHLIEAVFSGVKHGDRRVDAGGRAIFSINDLTKAISIAHMVMFSNCVEDYSLTAKIVIGPEITGDTFVESSPLCVHPDFGDVPSWTTEIDTVINAAMRESYVGG